MSTLVRYLHRGDASRADEYYTELFIAQTRKEAEELVEAFEKLGLGPVDGGYPDQVDFVDLDEVPSAKEKLAEVRAEITEYEA